MDEQYELTAVCRAEMCCEALNATAHWTKRLGPYGFTAVLQPRSVVDQQGGKHIAFPKWNLTQNIV